MKRLLPLFLSVSLSAHAQSIQQKIEVHLVEVPVTVIDSSGDPLRGLTKKNFTLFDEGKPKTISSFDVVDFASAESVSAISPLNPVARRSFLVLFDLGNAGPNSVQRAQKAARDFVSNALLPRDLAAVATIDFDGKYRLLTSFTTDRALIASAIDEPSTFRSRDPLGISNQTLAFNPQLLQSGMANNMPVSVGRGHRADAEVHELTVARDFQHYAEGLPRLRVERQVDAVGAIARTLESGVGRKQVVLLSEGMPAKILTGRDTRDFQETQRQVERIIRGTYAIPESNDMEAGDMDQDARFGNSATLTLLERMKQYYRRSDVVLHAIDIQGARVQQTTFEGKTVNSNEGLATLARATGGTIFENVNNVGDNFKRLLHQQEVVYILGFQTSDSDAKFHSLEVKVSGIPRRARVEYRDGYFPSRVASPVALTDAQIIMNDISQEGIRMSSFAAAMPGQVPVVIEADGRDLVNATPLNATARIAIYAFDESGVVRDRIFETITIDPAKLGDRGIKYFGTLSLPPGNYAIKSLLRVASSGRRGYARANLRVPPPGEFGLASFVVDETPSRWMMIKGEAHGESTYPFTINGDPIVPAVLPRIRAGQPSKIALFVQNALPEELTIDAGPGATELQSVKGERATKIMMQTANVTASGLDVSVRKKAEAALRAHIPVVLEEAQ